MKKSSVLMLAIACSILFQAPLALAEGNVSEADASATSWCGSPINDTNESCILPEEDFGLLADIVALALSVSAYFRESAYAVAQLVAEVVFDVYRALGGS